MAKRKRERMKAKERRHQRDIPDKNNSKDAASPEVPAASGAKSGQAETSTQASASAIATTPSVKRRGRPPKAASIAGAEGPQPSGSASSVKPKGRPAKTVRGPASGEEGAGRPRSRSAAKNKTAIPLELDFGASPHLQHMTPGWQQFYAAIRKASGRE
ncbi:hypothetical protein NLX71_14945 [Paenibacillus sp. MZ04-78.2]|uniref:hypothetical protein n=1 Tax=Paenibacillus sp. MZ04-78.2 TaxID=2962034 RepID=UPI0020B6B116|nr:hypothetical protein [Paenibacillus sp. MZ04-78.2]MCP3774588.1 hypothetical protein [Paenibacillus sp. MZ04-78.2]